MLGGGISYWEDQKRDCNFSIELESGKKFNTRAYAAPKYIKNQWMGKTFDGEKVVDVQFGHELMKKLKEE